MKENKRIEQRNLAADAMYNAANLANSAAALLLDAVQRKDLDDVADFAALVANAAGAAREYAADIRTLDAMREVN